MLISDRVFKIISTPTANSLSVAFLTLRRKKKSLPTRKSSLGSKVTLRTGASWPRSVFCWLLSDTSTTLTMKSLEENRETNMCKLACAGNLCSHVTASDGMEGRGTSAVTQHKCKLSNQ